MSLKQYTPYLVAGLCGVAAYHIQKLIFPPAHAVAPSRPTSYQVKYWRSRGRAEQVRLLLADCNVTWVDADEKDYQTITFFHQLPVLYELYPDGTVEVPQSISILRHLARVYGYYGKNEVDQTKVDYLSDGVSDWRVIFSKVGGFPAFGSHVEENHAYFGGNLEKYGSIYEKVLEHSTSGYLVGDGISFVDIQLLALLHEHTDVYPTSLDKFPFLKKFVAKMEGRPNLKAYLRSPARLPPDNKA